MHPNANKNPRVRSQVTGNLNFQIDGGARRGSSAGLRVPVGQTFALT
ncbi:hypothetical protein H6F98_31880 [Microcoleus sp. FACHB-SPT15]|nr:hypothetical protein [Microcoleus sp. FACHB-SPT15]MBD1810016.1 hypothetical protein [Microcoleus sp. FACHB-SPT15]